LKLNLVILIILARCRLMNHHLKFGE